ncbi:MAG: hypothetical protein KGD60_10510 [Candidatus Thorarchaeota archaeon]|nr:hypothetical protein [Candidatus Thorarchaeota archaeon]
MIRKTITLLFVFLMVSSIFMTAQTTNTSTLGFEPEQKSQVAETDLDRVTIDTNVLPNNGLEEWNTATNPQFFTTSRTVEKNRWLETTTVFEGSYSWGMYARAIDPAHYSEIYLTNQSQATWSNPTNLTLDFEWYLDSIGNPVDQDYFYLRIQMGGHYLFYYLGCENTGVSNSSYGDAFFMIDGATQTWNHHHRNLTSDFVEVFGVDPTTYQTMYWYVRSYTDTYARVFIDDVNLVNGTTIKYGPGVSGGDFEGGGGWTSSSPSDPADISQSSVRHEGDWSINMTAISNDYLARASVTARLDKRLSSINQGQLSFWWRIDDWINSTTNTLASMRVNAKNSTHSLNMYYYLCVGGAGTLPPVIGNDMKFQADSFNVTDTWNFFECNIWEDYNTYSTTDDLWIEDIYISVSANSEDSLLSVLIDEMSFTASIMNDMGYETQTGVGTPIHGWFDPETNEDGYTVTDFASSGTKAGNITLEDDDDFSYERELGNIEINGTTELIFDFNVYIETFNDTSEDFIFFEFQFGDGEALTYVIANASSEFESWSAEEDNFIILQDTVVTDDWLNFQLDLVHDYELIVGSLPDTTLDQIHLAALASKTNKLTAFLDDVYIYYDPAPGITNVGHGSASPLTGQIVTISATVVDATLETVVLNYRLDNATWMTQAMFQLGDFPFGSNFANLPDGTNVEYYIIATDAFGKSTDAMNGTDFFSFTVVATPQGFPLLPIVAVGVVLVIGVVIVLYMFVFKKKE